MAYAPLQYPNMRQELIEYLRELSDPEYQERYWVRGESPSENQMAGFDFPVHFLFDDTDLADDPESLVGVILYNHQEVEAISAVIKAMEDVFDEVGLEGADVEYVRAKSWPEVLSTSSAALTLLTSR